VKEDHIRVQLSKAGTASVLEINVEIPSAPARAVELRAATA